MKRIYKYLLTTFSALAMLSVTSCRDDTFDSFNNQSEYVNVSFTVAPEASSITTNTRADYPSQYPNGNPSSQYATKRISDGGKADMLIYGVYDMDGNLLEEYSEGTDPSLGVETAKGQTVKKVNNYPYTVNIKLKRGEQYKIAFWAQSSKTKAYNTSDLKKVEVIYSELEAEMLASQDAKDKPNGADLEDGGTAGSGSENEETPGEGSSVEPTLGFVTSTPNNDEYRDAFCRSVTIMAGADGVAQNLYLYRPLSQINVATAGYDYEIVTRNANVKFTHSKVRITRAPRYLDVVEDQVLQNTTAGSSAGKEEEAFAVVDFGYAPIPAYASLRNDDDSYDIPPYPSFTKWDWEYNRPKSTRFDQDEYDQSDWYLFDDENGTHYERNPYHPTDMKYDQYRDEEFLYVHLYELDEDGALKNPVAGHKYMEDSYGSYVYEDGVPVSDGPDGYLDYATLDANQNMQTETFKWLSMCYVLSNSDKENADIFDSVEVWLAGDAYGKDETKLPEIKNVPAQRNWRTNIVGELLTTPNNFEIILDRNFAGDYSMWNTTGEWERSGPLAPGAYYNAQDDVIEISSLQGLLWFQGMVNGGLKIRESKNKDEFKGQDYYFYDDEGVTQQLEYSKLLASYGVDISMPADERLKERILIATHQAYNKNNTWPESGNFHFTGTKDGKDYPATVRLMADINLGGIEWIPIGFECRTGEQPGFSYIQASHDQDTELSASNRVFYGIFDGNGHTISNLYTMRFNASVHENHLQETNYLKDASKRGGSNTRHPIDNPQWFGRGLFGQIGGNAKITNVKLINVDIKGCNGAAGIAAFAYGDAIEISDCVIEGGTIEAMPMYRGDQYNGSNVKRARSFARGVYVGGIVGYFNTDGGIVENNIVRNVEIKGVRRLGGIIGSVNQKRLGPDPDNDLDEGRTITPYRPTNPKRIANNRIENSILIATTFTSYGEREVWSVDANENFLASTGFGFNSGQLQTFAQPLIGGYSSAEILKDADNDTNGGNNLYDVVTDASNIASGLEFADFSIRNTESDYTYSNTKYAKNPIRSSTFAGTVPLNYLPMLSSWFVDDVTLTTNYYGEPSAYTRVNLHEFQLHNEKTTYSGYYKKAKDGKNVNFQTPQGWLSGMPTRVNADGSQGTVFYYPMKLPELTYIDYDEVRGGRAGLWVESITLTGKQNNVDDASVVITPTGVSQEGDCAIFICARNRHQFGYENNSFKIPTILNNLIVRGQPYAYTGILVSTNKNMKQLVLNKVNIYDVYQTIALDNDDAFTTQETWPNCNTGYDALNYNYRAELHVNNSNLRGYTNPGNQWQNITFEGTTLEKGATTGIGNEEDAWTCRLCGLGKLQDPQRDIDDANPNQSTKFIDCYFKAPYIIDMTEMTSAYLESNVEFTNCKATATNLNYNVTINYRQGCNKIVIDNDLQGRPYVEYYNGNTLLATDKNF